MLNYCDKVRYTSPERTTIIEGYIIGLSFGANNLPWLVDILLEDFSIIRNLSINYVTYAEPQESPEIPE